MIENLYVIGNGFDLHHDVNSRYSDFRDWLLANTRFAYFYKDEIESYFKCNDLWSSFEENIAKFDYESFSKSVARENRPNMMSRHPEASLEDARVEVENQLGEWWKFVKTGLAKWAAQLNRPESSKKIQVLMNGSYFLTFNYTLTLEELYGIPMENVLHIHGRVGDAPEEMYLGHGGELLPRNESKFDDFVDEYGQIDYSLFPDANDDVSERQAIDTGEAQVISWKKPVSQIIAKNEHLWLSFSTVKQVFIYGLGFSSVDMPYLKRIKAVVPESAVWQVSYHSIEDMHRIVARLTELNVRNHNFVRLQDIQVLP